MVAFFTPIATTVVAPPVLAFQDSRNSNTNALSYTFLTVALGTASATRAIFIATSQNLDTVTVGGTGLTLVASFSNANLWAGLITSGTTATVICSRASVTMANCAIYVWSVTDLLSLTAVDTQNNTSGSANVTAPALTTLGGGVAFAISQSTLGGTVTFTAGVTTDASTTADNNDKSAGGSASGLSAGTLTISANSPTASVINILVASFR